MFKILVIIQMVLRQVGEHGDSEMKSPYALLGKRMRRDFHHRRLAACSHQFRKVGQQIERLRRGVGGNLGLAAHSVLNRAENTA